MPDTLLMRPETYEALIRMGFYDPNRGMLYLDHIRAKGPKLTLRASKEKHK